MSKKKLPYLEISKIIKWLKLMNKDEPSVRKTIH